MTLQAPKNRLSQNNFETAGCICFIALSEDGDNSAVVGICDELLDRVALESLYESKSLFAVLIACGNGNNVCIGLRGVAGSILDRKGIFNLQTGLESIVAVDNGESAFVGIFKLCGDGVCLYGDDVVAAVVNDVEVVYALSRACIGGESDQAFLPENIRLRS